MKLDINNYPGSKNGSGVLKWIISKVPSSLLYVEMCGGSGVLGFELSKFTGGQRIIICEKYQPVFNQLTQKRICRTEHTKIWVRFIDSIEYYIDLLEKVKGFSFENCFFYFDPPYLKSERKSKRNLYGCEWSESDHKRMFYLIKLLNNQGAYVLVSHYDCSIYNDNFQNWFTDTIKTRTRSHTVIEKVWFNYDIAQMELACIDYIGKNYIDRQRIKRKQQNLLRKIQELPLHEQQAMKIFLQKHLYNQA